LGYKAWFGGVSIRDEYRALAWLICKMLRDGLVDYGIWMGERPKDEQASAYVESLNVAADAELAQRMKELSARICSPEDLTTITFDLEREFYDDFATACKEKGLSIQNGAHILIRRAITYFESECRRPS